jgi:hypothetical protein
VKVAECHVTFVDPKNYFLLGRLKGEGLSLLEKTRLRAGCACKLMSSWCSREKMRCSIFVYNNAYANQNTQDERKRLDWCRMLPKKIDKKKEVHDITNDIAYIDNSLLLSWWCEENV